ncbi:hypothetical protein HMPREF0578_2044 [Mobiluncus mulieris 28-1]|nr:hypothetical protein HMPREF0578_2044 [Mobiluncus mulieris 28-1]
MTIEVCRDFALILIRYLPLCFLSSRGTLGRWRATRKL